MALPGAMAPPSAAFVAAPALSSNTLWGARLTTERPAHAASTVVSRRSRRALTAASMGDGGGGMDGGDSGGGHGGGDSGGGDATGDDGGGDSGEGGGGVKAGVEKATPAATAAKAVADTPAPPPSPPSADALYDTPSIGEMGYVEKTDATAGALDDIDRSNYTFGSLNTLDPERDLLYGKRVSVGNPDEDGKNLEVYYRELGEPDAPVVLLLHGLPSSSFQFREVMPLLAKAGYRASALGGTREFSRGGGEASDVVLAAMRWRGEGGPIRRSVGLTRLGETASGPSAGY